MRIASFPAYISTIAILRNKMNQLIMKHFMCDESISHISMFHRITTDGIVSGNPNDCRIEDFINYIEYCERIGIEFITIDRLITMKSKDACKKKAVITFDDGYESMYSVAAKELEKRAIPFLCFIVTSFVGKKGFVSVNQLKDLSKNPLCTIGMHSDRHIFWRGKSAEELRDDYIKCMDVLGKITGYEPRYYAFPYGSCTAVSSENIKTVRKMAPGGIFLTDQRKLCRKDLKDPLNGLPRLDIAGYYSGIYRKEYKGLKIGE